jgi:hypothetical protein
MEPEVGFEPTTFRIRFGCSESIWSALDGSGLLTLGASSVQTAPIGSSQKDRLDDQMDDQGASNRKSMARQERLMNDRRFPAHHPSA